MPVVNPAKPGRSKAITDGRADKRARFQAQKRTGGASLLVLGIGLAVILAVVGGAILILTRSGPSAQAAAGNSLAEIQIYQAGGEDLTVRAATLGHAPYPLVIAENGVIRLPLSTFDDYRAHFYTYMHQGQPIEFFVLKSQDGVVRAAFNACDVCFAARKGYYQKGNDMVCSNCGNRFASNQINEVRGGCNPSPLDRTVDVEVLVIQVSDLVNGLFYFQG